MRSVTQFAGMQQHYAAVVRKGDGVYVVPETIRHREQDASSALAELELDLQGGAIAVERVYVSWEVKVKIPDTIAEARSLRTRRK